MATLAYHLDEVRIALDPTRPEHLLPDLHSCEKGVVDVGCGVGQLFVAKDAEIRPGVVRYGVDFDAEAIAYARHRWPHLAEFIHAKAESLPIPSASVDWYVSRVALPYTDVRQSLAEAGRVLTDHGHLWITLHPAQMVWREFVSAVVHAHPRSAITRAIVLFNGVTFHVTRHVGGLFGILESWQSRSAIVSLLHELGFRDVRVTRTARHFLVEANKNRDG